MEGGNPTTSNDEREEFQRGTRAEQRKEEEKKELLNSALSGCINTRLGPFSFFLEVETWQINI
jgi:hypothetical protein